MLTEQGFAVVQTYGARNTRTPPELREIVEVIHDTSYVVAFFNNAFERVDLPTLQEGDFILYAKRGLNPVATTDTIDEQVNEYQSIYQAIHDELSTFAALLPSAGNNSRNVTDYPVRYYHAVKLLERLETICNIEFTPRAITKDQAKQQLARM
jgi:hypothetical protein